MTEPADMVKCSVCQEIMLADKFAMHASFKHEDEVLALISDDDIIEGLSE